ncbi:sulfotransferase domain protein [bacterium BMS3Bbin04]|nr:sulfotransferase domain protein [bacterium BMS3Bbin04]
MNSHPFFFISGMFRSGTSLLARMLNAHPELAVASDPYAPLFKAFRNQVVRTTEPGQAFDPDAPLGDYYLNPRELVFYEAIQDASLDRPFSETKLFTLQEQIRQISAKSSPKIHPYLDKLKGNSYGELLASGVQIIREAYGDDHTKLVGFKEAMTNEFVPHILDTFPEAKAIVVQREPRAMAASCNWAGKKYPWIYLARQWRKLGAIAWTLTQNGFVNRDRVMLVSYESLIRRPKETMEQICEFLDVPFEEISLDPAKFVDGSGNPWMQDPEYVRGVRAFNPDTLSKWRERLSIRDCEFMERLCWPEMSLFQYQPVVMRRWVIPEDIVKHPPLIPENELVEWIKPYSMESKHAYVEELRKERYRWEALTEEKMPDAATQRSCCLSEKVYLELRAVAQKSKHDRRARVRND